MRFLLLTVLLLSINAYAEDVSSQAEKIDAALLMADLKYLSSDALEGRYVASNGSKLAQDYILKQLATTEVDCFYNNCRAPFVVPLYGSKLPGTNLLGQIKGSERNDHYIVLSAHYDHLGKKEGQIFNGADDNASGVAALLAIARYLSQNKPKNSVIFAFFDAEEEGIAGSNYFVQHPPVPLGSIMLNINLDMVSRSDNELYLAGTFHYPFLKSYLKTALAGTDIKLLLGHDSPDLGADDWTNASDHIHFHRMGIPFLYFGVEDHPDYHKPSDTFERINQKFYLSAVNRILDVLQANDASLKDIELQAEPFRRETPKQSKHTH